LSGTWLACLVEASPRLAPRLLIQMGAFPRGMVHGSPNLPLPLPVHDYPPPSYPAERIDCPMCGRISGISRLALILAVVSVRTGHIQAQNHNVRTPPGSGICTSRYAAVRGNILYLATWSPGSSNGPNDHYIMLTNALLPSASAPASSAKTGLVATAATKPFIGAESLSSYCGWFNAPASAAVAKSACNSGQLEGTIDLLAAFGPVLPTI
jgi:hypothetical protein